MNLFERSMPSRRAFFHAAAAAGLALPPSAPAAETEKNVFGPLPGYSPQIGTLVSEMTWMRDQVQRAVKGMTVDQLDFLLDAKANRIGALLLHLAASERLFQLNTFDKVDTRALFTSAAYKDWAVPMQLGEPARRAIKGHDLEHYLKILGETRENTLAAFRKRDDEWLLAVDRGFPWGPTNNLCKWFHVCEHESHHAGQISLLKGRAPGAKSSDG